MNTDKTLKNPTMKWIQKVSRLFQKAYKNHHVVSDEVTEEDMKAWLQDTWRKSLDLPIIFPGGDRRETSDMLSTMYTDLPDKFVQLIVWSCLTKDCHNSIMTSLTGDGIGKFDPGVIISLLNLYVMCTQIMVELICANTLKFKNNLNDLDKKVAASPLLLQSRYLPYAMARSQEIFIDGQFLSLASKEGGNMKFITYLMEHLTQVKIIAPTNIPTINKSFFMSEIGLDINTFLDNLHSNNEGKEVNNNNKKNLIDGQEKDGKDASNVVDEQEKEGKDNNFPDEILNKEEKEVNDGKKKLIDEQEEGGKDVSNDIKGKFNAMKHILTEVMNIKAIKKLADCIKKDTDFDSLDRDIEDAADALNINYEKYGVWIAVMTQFLHQLNEMAKDEVRLPHGAQLLVNEIHPIIIGNHGSGKDSNHIYNLVEHFENIASGPFLQNVLSGSSSNKRLHIPGDDVWKEFYKTNRSKEISDSGRSDCNPTFDINNTNQTKANSNSDSGDEAPEKDKLERTKRVSKESSKSLRAPKGDNTDKAKKHESATKKKKNSKSLPPQKGDNTDEAKKNESTTKKKKKELALWAEKVVTNNLSVKKKRMNTSSDVPEKDMPVSKKRISSPVKRLTY